MKYVEFFAIRHGSGQVLPNAVVTVILTETGANADLFDIDGDPISNPTAADAIGKVGFAVANGIYDILIVSGDYSAPPIENMEIVDSMELADAVATLLADEDGVLRLEDFEKDGSGVIDGDGPMIRRAKAASIAQGKYVIVPPRVYSIAGTFDSAQGVLSNDAPGTPAFICLDGEATFVSAISTDRSLLSLTGGGGWFTSGIKYDGTNITSNFTIKMEGAGDFRFGTMEVTKKGFRRVGVNGKLNGEELRLTDIQGHGCSAGSATGQAFGASGDGYIGRVIVTDCTSSGFNWSATKVTGKLQIGSVSVRWTKWKADGTGQAYPTRYAAVRLGNGTSNITINYVYAEGVYRGVRLTDTDACIVVNEEFKNLIGPAILFNKKDQRARNSGVLNLTGVGPNRGNKRNDIGVSDKDSELVPGESDIAGGIQEGIGWICPRTSVSADENSAGSGLITASTASATVTNLDTNFVGQDYNCFKDVVVGDLLFTTAGVVLNKVSAIAPRRYFSDAGATTIIGTARAGTMTVALGGTAVTGVGTNFSGTMAVGDWLYDANGSKIGPIGSFGAGGAGATSLTLSSPALIAVTGGAFRSGALPASGGSATQSLTLTGLSAATVAGVAYEIRTPDDYFYVANTGNITIVGNAITNNSLAAASGTITTSLSSAKVTGVGTDFDGQAQIGKSLFTTGNVVIGQISDIDDTTPNTVLTLTANAAVALAGQAFKIGWDFTKQFDPADLIFDESLNYAGVVATVPDPLTATLAASTLAPITAAPFRYGKLYKVRIGIEVAATATKTNINPADILVVGAATQYKIHEPQGMKANPAPGFTVAQLAALPDLAAREGERFFATNLVPMGPMQVIGGKLVRESSRGYRQNSPMTTDADFTVTYREFPPKMGLTGARTAIRSITVSDTDLPDGEGFVFVNRTTGDYPTLIKNGAGTTIITIKAGQTGAVVNDNGTLRQVLISPSGSSALLPSIPVTTAELAALIPATHTNQLFTNTDTGRLWRGTGSAFVEVTPNTFALGTALLPTITFTGDPNTGLWSPAADTVALSTNGAERLRVLSDGKVGIGVTAPNALLQVFGLINFDSTTLNTSLGDLAGRDGVTASMGNTAVGKEALKTNNVAAARNTAVGYISQRQSTIGTNNTSVGYQSCDANIDGSFNTGIGSRALSLAVGGSHNTALGGLAMYNTAAPGSRNTGLGYSALSVNTGNDNTGVGYLALLTNLSGGSSVGVGSATLRYNSAANSCVAVGYEAGRGLADHTNTGGVYIGFEAGISVGTGADYNTVVGYRSGRGITTGLRNTLIGPSVGSGSYNQVTTGSRNIAIGNDVALADATGNDQLVIGNLIYGTGLTGTGTTISSSGLIGIGTKAPTAKLHLWTGSSTGSVNALADELLIEGSGQAGLSILTPDTTGVCNIFFGHNNDNDAGRIVYTHNGDHMSFYVNGVETARIDSTGDLGIGVTDPTQKLHVNGAIKQATYTVAGLAALTGTVGTRSFVTDATATTFASIVAGGGANAVPVYHDGTDWRIG